MRPPLMKACFSENGYPAPVESGAGPRTGSVEQRRTWSNSSGPTIRKVTRHLSIFTTTCGNTTLPETSFRTRLPDRISLLCTTHLDQQIALMDSGITLMYWRVEALMWSNPQIHLVYLFQ